MTYKRVAAQNVLHSRIVSNWEMVTYLYYIHYYSY
jgi:hypothetical protein